jgi:hypothetical protein
MPLKIVFAAGYHQEGASGARAEGKDAGDAAVHADEESERGGRPGTAENPKHETLTPEQKGAVLDTKTLTPTP